MSESLATRLRRQAQELVDLAEILDPSCGSDEDVSKSTQQLARRIRSRLVMLGLSARAASEKTGRGPDVIRNILRAADAGESYFPRTDTLIAIADALAMNVADLLPQPGIGVPSDLISLWPSLSSFAEDAGVPYGTAKQWRRRNSIPVDRWPRIMSGAAARNIELSYEVLVSLHASEAEGAAA